MRRSDVFDIAALYLHDACCDSDLCYDANAEQHRFGPTVDDYGRAERLIAALGLSVTRPAQSVGFCANCVERCEGQHGPCFSEDIGCTEDFRPDDVSTEPQRETAGGEGRD